jgi:branched-chain amino acid transport system permease protein
MLGGYYAIVGIGLALTFGIMRLVNLAHGDFLIAAAYMSVVMLNFIPISPFLTLAFVMPVMFCIGYLLQRFILNRVSIQAVEKLGLSSAMGVMSPLLVTFGLSIVIGHTLFAVFSMDTAIIRNELSFSAIPLTKDLSIPALRLVSFCLAMVIMLSLHLFLRKTNYGRAIRAASDDAEIAPLMGMKTGNIYALASGISLSVAGVGGVMVGMARTFQPFDGPQFLLMAFGVVILGGLGSMVGILVGGVLLGITQVLAGTYFGSSAQHIAGYLVILLVLALRPQGLFAR